MGNHNQSRKNHKNGIKRIPRNRYLSSKGVHQTLRKNNRRARKFDPSINKEKNLSSKIEFMRKNTHKIMQAIKARIEKALMKKRKAKEQKDKPKRRKKKLKNLKNKYFISFNILFNK